MGHSIRAMIGTLEIVRQIESEWLLTQTAVLPQGYGMIFLTDALFDGLTELTGASAAPLTPRAGLLYRGCSSIPGSVLLPC